MSSKKGRTILPTLVCVLILGLLALAPAPTAVQAAQVTITNGTQFTDTSGNVVHAHGGGVIKVGSFYYWFGENRVTKYVDVYRSTDLKTWSPVSQVPGADVLVEFRHIPPSTDPYRFYRIVQTTGNP